MFGGIESTALLPAVLGSSNIKPTPAAKFADKAIIAVRKLKVNDLTSQDTESGKHQSVQTCPSVTDWIHTMV